MLRRKLIIAIAALCIGQTSAAQTIEPLLGAQETAGEFEFTRSLQAEQARQSTASFAELVFALSKNERNRLFFKLSPLNLPTGAAPEAERRAARADEFRVIRPGTEIGTPRSICLNALCGTGRVPMPLEIGTDAFDRTGPICPETYCPGSQRYAGCVGALCSFPMRQALTTTADGGVTLDFRKLGFPETVLLSRLHSGDDDTFIREPECTATMISATLALTALHCLAEKEAELLKRYTRQADPKADGWSRLKFRRTAQEVLGVLSDLNFESQLVDAVSIPYPLADPIPFINGLPDTDLALLHLASPLELGPGSYPFLQKNYAQEKAAISFAGYGWTNLGGQTLAEWNQNSQGENWRSLKLNAYNFIQSTTPNATAPRFISWTQGKPAGTGSPCHGDSGGPIYAGFNRGYWNNPRQVIGVVSYMLLPDGTKVTRTASDCLNRTAVGVHVAPYFDAICKISDGTARGCAG